MMQTHNPKKFPINWDITMHSVYLQETGSPVLLSL